MERPSEKNDGTGSNGADERRIRAGGFGLETDDAAEREKERFDEADHVVERLAIVHSRHDASPCVRPSEKNDRGDADLATQVIAGPSDGAQVRGRVRIFLCVGGGKDAFVRRLTFRRLVRRRVRHRTETCRFSGLRIYPGKGSRFVRGDGQVFIFLSRKVKSMFFQRKRPSKLAWTTQYRKAHKKDQVSEQARKKRRTRAGAGARSIGNVSVEVIQKKRQEKTEVRAAARDAALREIKERNKKMKEAKKAQTKKSGKR